MANFPAFPVSFVQKVNLADIVRAEDVNVLYDEVTSIANISGINPHKRPLAWNSVNTFDTTTTNYASISARISNVENGTFIVYNDYVSKSGGTTIAPSGTTTVNLSLKAAASQTANTLEVKNSANVTVASISATGALQATTINCGTP